MLQISRRRNDMLSDSSSITNVSVHSSTADGSGGNICLNVFIYTPKGFISHCEKCDQKITDPIIIHPNLPGTELVSTSLPLLRSSGKLDVSTHLSVREARIVPVYPDAPTLGRGSITDALWRWGRARGCDDVDVGKDPMWKAGFMGSTLKQGWNWPVVLTGIIFVSKFMSIVIRSTILRHFIALLHLFWDVQYFKTSFPLHEWSN